MDGKRSLNLITLGCAKNRVDSEHLLGALRNDYEISYDSDRPSDVVVINTCGFILDAKQEAIDTILRAVQLKQTGKIEELYVFGCLSERYADELRTEIPDVDRYFGVNSLKDIVNQLGGRNEIGVERINTTPGHYAYLKIAEGCNWMCGYCAIPLIRGRYRSVPLDEVVREAEYLASSGVKELILIAQDITYYGLDLYGKRMLCPLIQKLSDIKGIVWIRLHYGYPADFPMDVIREMAENPKVCHYLDLPFQHISDNILGAMKRRISKEETYRLIDSMRSLVPDLCLRTTLLVGYPGETEKDIRELEEFVQYARFEKLGVFTYSEEEGTYSAKHLKDNVSEQEKQARLDRIMSLQREVSSGNLEKLVGRTVKVIVDGREGEYYIGRTQWDSPEVDGVVYITSEKRLFRGNFYDCMVTDCADYDLYAKRL